LSHLKAATRWLIITLKEEVTGNHTRQPSPVTIMRSQKQTGPLGRNTIRGSRMYLTGPHILGPWGELGAI